MTVRGSEPRSLPALTPIEHFILLAILTTARHGIGIFEVLAFETGNKLVLSPGTLYSALRRMLAHGWIQMIEPEDMEEVSNDRRKFYLATPLGQAKIKEMAEWFSRELQVATAALEELERRDVNTSQPNLSDTPGDVEGRSRINLSGLGPKSTTAPI